MRGTIDRDFRISGDRSELRLCLIGSLDPHQKVRWYEVGHIGKSVIDYCSTDSVHGTCNEQIGAKGKCWLSNYPIFFVYTEKVV